MKSYDTGKLRNVCLVGHGGAGKTSLAEALLFNSGVINRIGKVSDGNTVSDYLPEEVKHQLSISTSLIPVETQGVKINILDTPGYSDFIGEVISSLRVVESSLLVLCGVSGLEVQAEIVWDIMDEFEMPRVIFVNKMDRENANAKKVLDQLQTSYPDTRFVPMQIPIGQEAAFEGVIDIVKNKAYYYEGNGSGKYTVKEVPDSFKPEIEVAREVLIEAASESNDEILIKYLEGESIDDKDMVTILKGALEQKMIVPVLFGSAFKNIGVNNLLEFISENTPAPKTQKDKTSLVFKTMADPYVGKMSFFRVYGGEITAESVFYNSTKDIEEKIGQPFYLRGKTQESTSNVTAGDIAVVAKLQETTTGDTLCAKDNPIKLTGIDFPRPSLTVAIEPKSKGDEDKLSSALNRLAEEDPTIQIEKNLETKELILFGMGEMHLEILTEKLARKFGVGVNMKVPRIPYRETIRKPVKVEGKHKKQSGGHGQYGHVWLNIEPHGEDFEFGEQVFGGAVPRQYFPAVEKGIREAMVEGVLAGYPVTNFKVTLYDGSYHSVDSSEMAFKLAAIMAFRKGAELASPVLLEPIVEVEVKIPEAFMGDVIGDLNSKRGRVLGMEPMGKYQLIKAHVPQAEMLRYAIDLKSLTQGRGIFSMKFFGYEEVPTRLQDTIVKQIKEAQSN